MGAAPPPSVSLPAPARANHGAGVIALRGGAVLACWYSGSHEAARDVVIVCSRSGDGGTSWSGPQAISRPGAKAAGAAAPAKSVGNVVLARDRNERLVMLSGEIQSRRRLGVETCRSWRCGRIDFRISTDQGRTWSTPTRLDDRPGALPRSAPFHEASGMDLLPVYLEAGRPSLLELDLAALTPGREPSPAIQPIPAPGPLLQPSLVQRRDGTLLAFLRDRRRRAIHVSARPPGATAWGPARPTSLGNPDSAVEAFQDDRGRTVLIYNPGRRSRARLSLAFSADGLAFTPGCDLAPPGAGAVAYPAVTPLGPGQWGVVYSSHNKQRIEFARFDQAFLDLCAGPR